MTIASWSTAPSGTVNHVSPLLNFTIGPIANASNLHITTVTGERNRSDFGSPLSWQLSPCGRLPQRHHAYQAARDDAPPIFGKRY